jgi:hypothetical protein
MAITKEFVFEQYGALTPRVLDAWRNLGRLEGAQQVYSQLHLKLADDELQAEIEAANTAHRGANAATTADVVRHGGRAGRRHQGERHRRRP